MNNSPNNADQPTRAAEEVSRDPFFDYRAQHAWPQPPPSTPVRRTSSALRTVGIGALGLIGGLLAALILQDVLGVAFLRDSGEINLALALVIGMLMPVLSVAGVGVALVIDHVARTRQPRNRPRSSDESR